MLVSAAAIRFHLHNVAFSSSLSGVDGEEGDHHVLVGAASVRGFDEMEAIEGLKPSSELLWDFPQNKASTNDQLYRSTDRCPSAVNIQSSGHLHPEIKRDFKEMPALRATQPTALTGMNK